MRIGIVGAGISGLTVAHNLLLKGYDQVCVMDQSQQVGGKCYTLTYRGKSYEMGAIMGLASHERVKKLMRRFHMNSSSVPLSRGHYGIDGKPITQLDSELRALFFKQLARLPKVLGAYPWLNTIGYEHCPEDLAQPFFNWCQEHDLNVLAKIYEQCFTTFGFGDIRSVPAGYVLKVITYDNLIGFLEISRIITWSKGTGALMEKMADQVPELYLNQKVEKIEVMTSNEGVSENFSNDSIRNNKIKVQLSSGVQLFDRLIFTGDLTQLPQIMGVSEPIQEGLAKVKWEKFHVYAFSVKGIPELCGYVPENLKKERVGHLTVWYYRWPMEQDSELITVYVYEDEHITEAERVQRVVEDLEGLGCSNIHLYNSKGWRHFPHFEGSEMRTGFFEAIEALQGVNGIYYAGELLAGPNLENCVAYSENLVSKFF